jgi:hypothetical protein
MRSRPVSGLAGFDVSPSHELEHSQWHQEFSEKVPCLAVSRNAIAKQAFYGKLLLQSFLFDTPTPAYRCGGSPGIQETLNKSCRRTYIQRFLTWFPFNSTAQSGQSTSNVAGILPEPQFRA